MLLHNKLNKTFKSQITLTVFKNIESSLNDNLPFVCYRKPNENNISCFFQHDDILHSDKNLNTSGFIFAPFDDNEPPVIIPKENSRFIQEIYSETKNKNNINLNLNSLTSKEKHIKLIKKGIEAIHNKKLEKVVLTRKEVVHLKENKPIEFFKNLLCSYENAFVYIWFHPKIGLWLGATPETLVKTKNKNFETMSLAGTLAFQGNTSPNWTIKEIEEQQLVTDYIIKKLSPLCKVIKSGKAETVKAGKLLHLKTKINGTLAAPISKLIKTLHPTPAVCGLPKDISRKFIQENESYKRTFYTGYLGELDLFNKTELYVNLRCMEIKDSKALIYVGGGITKDSLSEDEWIETIEKSKTIKKIL